MTLSKNFLAILLGLTLFAGAACAQSYKGEKLAVDAKFTIEQARAIALKAHPGIVTDEELEKESGGSGLRYSFDIKNNKDDKVTYEVGVDAKTGKVLENKKEGKNPD
ncbi:putative membrane protein YkoI [Oxalobacteraceae bacterium GrIS 2.11]